MGLEIADSVTIASGDLNEDRVGATAPLAWVIDGATDVLPEPLTIGGTDAAWFAAAMTDELHALAAAPPASLSDLPHMLAHRIAPRFHAEARRAPSGPEEHPSAAAIIVRRTDPRGDLEYVSLGDCALLAEVNGRVIHIGVDEADAGDRWVADLITGRSATAPEASPRSLTRAELWPHLQARRAHMNTENGYGIFSITPAPQRFISHGVLSLPAGSRVMLATDGLMRLVDVFERYDHGSLVAAAWSNGLAALAAELRALETADLDCTQFPRAKVSDDTTALLLRITED